MLDIIFQNNYSCSQGIFPLSKKKPKQTNKQHNTTLEINTRLFEVFSEVLYKHALELQGGKDDIPLMVESQVKELNPSTPLEPRI